MSVTRKRYILGLLGLAVTAGAGGAFWFGCGHDEFRLAGVVETQEVRLSSKIGGRIGPVLVQGGEAGQKGQQLVLLEAPELEARRDQLRAQYEAALAQQARAVNGPRNEEKAAARATVAAARAKLARLKAGFRSEEIAAALAEWNALQADVDK